MASFNSLPSLSTGATPGAAGGIEAFDGDLGFDESMLLVNCLLSGRSSCARRRRTNIRNAEE